MKNTNLLQDAKKIALGEIGNRAKYLDTELSIFERMKLEKKSLKKLAIALAGYGVAMVLMAHFI